MAKPRKAGTKVDAPRARRAHPNLPPDVVFDPNLLFTLRIVLVARRWRSLLDRRLRPLGHSAPRMEVMSAIAHSSEFSPQIETARRIGVEGPTLVRMLDLLEADGLVERLPDPNDRRANRIKLTSKGEEAFAEINAVADSLRTHMLAGFEPSDIEQASQFIAQLLARFEDTVPTT